MAIIMNDTKIVLKEHLCKRCNKKVIQRIELRLGLNNKGEYTNKYCLNCDARLRESDIKEVRTDFDCPNCKSFLNSGFVNVCGGCGGFLSWVTLDGKMFKLPKEEFKKKLIEMLIPLTHIQEPKNKHEVEIKEFMCPFCEHKETINVREQIWNENTKGWEVIGVDYWECQKCGEEIEKVYKIVKAVDEGLFVNPQEEWEQDYYEDKLIDKKGLKQILKKLKASTPNDSINKAEKEVLVRKYHTYTNIIDEKVYRNVTKAFNDKLALEMEYFSMEREEFTKRKVDIYAKNSKYIVGHF